MCPLVDFDRVAGLIGFNDSIAGDFDFLFKKVRRETEICKLQLLCMAFAIAKRIALFG